MLRVCGRERPWMAMRPGLWRGGGCFAGLRDPRVQASCERLLFDIVSISILAMACGADDWTDLETFGNKR